MTTRPMLAVAFIVALAAIGTGLRSAPAAPTTDTSAPITAFVEPSAPGAAEICALADRATRRLGLALVNEATAANQAASPSAALTACHLQGPDPSAPLPDQPRVTAYKRTSLKLRDPANAPDAAEQLALDRMRAILDAGDLPPKLLVQQLTYPDGRAEWRVYRNVVALPACMKCHGPTEEIAPELLAELQRRYPGDQATGYATGDWRGLMRLSLTTASAAAPRAK